MVIGSTAISHWFSDFKRKPKDLDILKGSMYEASINQTFNHLKREYLENPILLRRYNGTPFLRPSILYTLKISHSFWDLPNNSWDKHMWDIQFLKDKGCVFDKELFEELFEFWNKLHGKRLDSFEKTAKIIKNEDISSKEFFNNKINNVIDHDDYHDLLIKHPYFEGQVLPTYTKVLMDFEEVDVSEEKFNKLTEKEKFNLVFEELIVMATEPRFPEEMYWKEKYKRMLKDFIINHCKVWQGIWIIQNHKKLLTEIPFNGISYLNSKIK